MGGRERESGRSVIMKSIWAKIIGGSLPLLAVRIISKLATISVMVFVARRLGKDGFGVYSTILAITSLSGTLADFGLVLPTIRSIAKKDGNEQNEVAATFSARIVWSSVALILASTVGIVYQVSLPVILFFAISSIMEASSTALIRSFEGKLEMKTVTFYTFAERAAFCVMVLSALSLFGQLQSVAIATCFSYGVMFLVSLFLFQRRFGRLRLHFSFSDFGNYSAIGLPFFITVVFSTIYYRADTLLLGTYRNEGEVGIYNVALRVIDALMFIPMTVMATILPTLSRLFKNEYPMFLHVFKRSLLAFAVMGLLASLCVFLAAPLLIRLLFSSTFDDSSGALRVLSIMLTFNFVNWLLTQSLIAIHREIDFTAIMIVSALLSISGNMFLIPMYGYLGAAWMRVFVESASCISAAVILLWHFKRKAKEIWTARVAEGLVIR